MKLLKQIETLFHGRHGRGADRRPVARAVRRGAGRRSEAAFEALVDRHGAMVLRVCRQVLGDEHESQDASQATFLVLARRAGSIGRRESVASWLHGVALRVAAKARLANARRRKGLLLRGAETMAGRLVVVQLTVEIRRRGPGTLRSACTTSWADLPESFREPLVLCYLEGLTQEQAGVAGLCHPVGTIQSRLARGRAKLKSRLSKRGFELVG